MSPIFVAIDTPDLTHALDLAKAVREHVGGVKLGLEFFAANGPAGVAQVAALGLPIFLDLKLHDIPNTVAKAVAALAPLKPKVLTVHAGGGVAMMAAAKAAAPEGTNVVGVTVLTSLDGDDLHSVGIAGTPGEQVTRLARLCFDAKLDGIVCSGAEIAITREKWPDGFHVVPGVRRPGGDVADQKRVVTPLQAVDDGASIIVIGRPITAADDPAGAARAIADSLKGKVE